MTPTNTVDRSASAKRSAKDSFARALHWIGMCVPWLLLAVSIGLVAEHTRNPRTLLRLYSEWAEYGALALILTPIIISGGIDLSVGAIVALSGMVLGILLRDLSCPIWLAAGGAVAAGVVAGAMNGSLVAFGLSPLVTTLATMAFFRGLAMAIAGTAEQSKISAFPASSTDWQTIIGLPVQYWVLAGVFAFVSVGLHFHRTGRWCFATGDNRTAARIAGVPTVSLDWWLYTSSGAVCGIVALAAAMKRESVTPDVHVGAELNAIACVVVGGTLITGGRGSAWKTLLGVAVLANLDIGLPFLRSSFAWLSSETRQIFVGVLLVLIAVLNERNGEIKFRRQLISAKASPDPARS